MSGSGKPKFPRADALAVARELVAVFTPATSRLVIAGSLRRRKAMVGDVEVLFIPRFSMVDSVPDLLGNVASVKVSQTDESLQYLLDSGVLDFRLNELGRRMWGERNKLAIHKASGIPVDLFSATDENWWNYLVCRTGSAVTNTRICNAAIERHWHWCPYDAGFRRGGHSWETARARHAVKSEREVFEFVGLEYQEPWERL